MSHQTAAGRLRCFLAVEQAEGTYDDDPLFDGESLTYGDLRALLAECEQLGVATKFTFGKFGDPMRTEHEYIDVEARPGFEGIRWSIVCSGWAYTHQGTWIHEPIPGERKDDYLDATRWESRDDAIAIARRLIAEGHPMTQAWLKGRRLP